jgi:CheY-like chemotaxis protein
MMVGMSHSARCKLCGEVVLEDAGMLAGVESVRLFDHLATRHPAVVKVGAPAAHVQAQYRLEAARSADTARPLDAAPAPLAGEAAGNGIGDGREAGALAPILVVEDNPDVREAEAVMLESAGYRTVEADNGDHALRVLHTAAERPCLILLDLMMPVMDGIEFRRAQLADPALADIPVVVVSAFDRAGDAAELQVNAYVPKPVDYDRLLATVEQHCGPPA